jgi:hypothetical protein
MISTIQRIVRASMENAYTYLLIALLFVFFVAPFIVEKFSVGWVDDYLLIGVILSGLFAITRNRRHVLIGLVFALPAIVSRMFNAHTVDLPTPGVMLVIASAFAFFCYLLWHVLGDVLTGQRLTSQRIIGAIVGYLVIGLVWALIYGFIEVVEPGSFAISDSIAARVEANPEDTPFSVLVYFSFVTLTTLGYGDVSPVNDLARNFAWLEAMVGQLYLAIMIAGLVAIRVSEGQVQRSGAAPSDGGSDQLSVNSDQSVARSTPITDD